MRKRKDTQKIPKILEISASAMNEYQLEPPSLAAKVASEGSLATSAWRGVVVSAAGESISTFSAFLRIDCRL